MADVQPLVRQWLLITTLFNRTDGLSIEQLARDLNVGLKTIRRDLKTLQDAGFRLEMVKGDHGKQFWRISSKSANCPIQLTWSEAAALWIARRVIASHTTAFWGPDASRAFAKVKATFDEATLAHLERMTDLLHLTNTQRYDAGPKAALIEGLMKAILERRITHLTYQSNQATEAVTRDVYPLGWVCHNEAVYLIAHDPQRRETRTYKSDRMSAVDVSDMQFNLGGKFSLEEYLSGTIGVFTADPSTPLQTILVRFDASVARYASEHRTISRFPRTTQPSGAVDVEFHLNSTNELKSLILSFGPKAVVLEPESFRNEIAAELQTMLSAYDSPSTPKVNTPARKKPRPK